MSVHPPHFRLSVEDYHKMAETGILKASDRVELIRGTLYIMSPIGSKHAAVVSRLEEQFFTQLGGQFIIRSQNPVWISDDSEPEPDLAICLRTPDFYASGHPKPGDIRLIVEVSDTTLEYDQTIKRSLYAGSGIEEYWVVDVEQNVLHQYLRPRNGVYQEDRMHGKHSDLMLPGGKILSLTSIFS